MTPSAITYLVLPEVGEAATGSPAVRKCQAGGKSMAGRMRRRGFTEADEANPYGTTQDAKSGRSLAAAVSDRKVTDG